MTPDQIIASIASTAAALSAVATLLTVREIAKQRQASYRPELVFEGQAFRIVDAASDKEAFKARWEQPGNSTQETSLQFKLRLLNIGLGAAKAVTLTWDFNVPEAIQIVNRLAQSAFIGEIFEYKNGMVSARSRNNLALMSNWIGQRVHQIDYVLPSESAQAATLALVPHAYLLLISKMITNAATLKDFDSFDVPSLRVKVEYGDIGEKFFSVEYDVKTEISVILSPNQSDGAEASTVVNGSFRISRVEKSPFAAELAKEAILISESMMFPGLERTISSLVKLARSTKNNRR